MWVNGLAMLKYLYVVYVLRTLVSTLEYTIYSISVFLCCAFVLGYAVVALVVQCCLHRLACLNQLDGVNSQRMAWKVRYSYSNQFPCFCFYYYVLSLTSMHYWVVIVVSQ